MLQFLSITLFALFLTGCISGSPASDRENDLKDTQVFDAWVEFRNKGIETDEQRTEMIAFLERNYNPKALARRKTKRTFPGLFDDRDFPVRETYLEQVSQTGAIIKIVSRWLNGTSVLATSDQLQEIKTLECVQWVGDIHEHIKNRNHYSDPAYTQEIIDPGAYPRDFESYEAGFYGLSSPQIQQLNLHSVHEKGLTGKGVVIAILDTGFDLDHKAFNHTDKPVNVLKQWDLVNDDLNTKPEKTDPIGQHLHGTLVLGTITAYVPGDFVGSAYDASFILCKAEDVIEEYPLEERWFVTALEFAESNGADVITSSLVIYDHYNESQLNGETSVMSIGWNIATGNGVIGMQGGGNAGHDHNLYTTASGVSIATPLFAGGIACILQAHPEWSVEEIRKNLFRTGHYFREAGTWDTTFVQGYGIPDFLLMLSEN